MNMTLIFLDIIESNNIVAPKIILNQLGGNKNIEMNMTLIFFRYY